MAEVDELIRQASALDMHAMALGLDPGRLCLLVSADEWDGLDAHFQSIQRFGSDHAKLPTLLRVGNVELRKDRARG